MKTFFINYILVSEIILLLSACEKTPPAPPTPPPPPVDTAIVIKPQVDPPLSNTMGFFMNDWQPKSFTVPPATVVSTLPPSTGLVVNIDKSIVLTKIPNSVYGNNSNIWMTQIVTENALMDHITALKPDIIRFPGGSISDVFFWNAEKNVPPADAPSQLLNAAGVSSNAGYWYGKNSESWTFSVANYYNLLQQTGNEGMITINYGYARYGKGVNPVAAAAHLAADWVRYDNGRTKYWEIGNENFGDWEAGYRIRLSDNKDGQPEYVSGQLYGQHFKVFADSMKKAALEIGKTIYIGAVTSESAPQSWWTPTAANWNTGLFIAAANTPDYYIVHNYYTPYQTNATADIILNTPIPVTKSMMDYVKQSIAIAGLIQKPVILSEWNIFSTGSMQQVSHINGLHADMVLGEALINNFGMTARWDFANGWDGGNDHGMFNQGDEPDGVPKWNPRPAFYHMYYFQKNTGDRLIASNSSNSDLISYASSFTSGEVATVLINKSASALTAEVKVTNFRLGKNFYWYTLTGGGDNGEFSRKVLINGKGPIYASGGPADYKTISANSAVTSGGIRVTVPARSAVFLVIAP